MRSVSLRTSLQASAFNIFHFDFRSSFLTGGPIFFGFLEKNYILAQ